jgi:hypothetical protein
MTREPIEVKSMLDDDDTYGRQAADDGRMSEVYSSLYGAGRDGSNTVLHARYQSSAVQQRLPGMRVACLLSTWT